MTRSGPLVATACILLAPILRAQPAPTCEQWNTEEFFRVATVEDVTACLDAGSDVSARTDEGYTPLHHAAQESEQPEVVDALLTAGADPDTRDQHGDTPLSLAAFDVSSRTAVVESLLAAGANPSVPKRTWFLDGNPVCAPQFRQLPSIAALADLVHRSRTHCRVDVVGRNESADLLAQLGDAGEQAAPERAALQLAEPSLDGIEPGRAGRREVQVKAGMGSQKVPYRFGGMRASCCRRSGAGRGRPGSRGRPARGTGGTRRRARPGAPATA